MSTVPAASAVLRPAPAAGRYDHAARKRSKRGGREAGCWIYIAADELAKAGFDPGEPPPFYRVWGAARGRALVQLYRKP